MKENKDNKQLIDFSEFNQPIINENKDPFSMNNITLSMSNEKIDNNNHIETQDDEPIYDVLDNSVIEDDLNQKKPCPIIKANIFSKLFYFWISDLLKVGYQRPIKATDLYSLGPDLNVYTLGDNMEKSFKEESKKGKEVKRLIMSFFKLIWKNYFLAAIPLLYAIIVNMIIPIITSQLIVILTSPSEPAWYGYRLVLLYLGIVITSSVAQQYHYMMLQTNILRVNTMLTTMVYRKTLRISGVDQGSANTLLNIDPNRVANVLWTLHNIWSLPLEISLITVLLYKFLGVSCFVPLAVATLVSPINYFTWKGLNKTSEKIMEYEDERVKSLTEILQGIMIIKLFSWEGKATNSVNEVRLKETNQIKSFNYKIAALMFMILSLTSIMSVVTFSIYSLLGNKLEAKVIFPSIILFNSLMWPVLQVPNILSRLSECWISLKRLNKFLITEEPIPLDRECRGEKPGIKINNGFFKWIRSTKTEDEKDGKEEKEEKNEVEIDYSFLLENINFEAKQGQLVGVIGRIGSGKTSLLHSILGEMEKVSGELEVKGSLGYVSQQAWIRNVSLRDNILFGRKFDEKLYRKILGVCCLASDIKSLPAGDLTEIGEKGVNLSGGQKQRVALARALYAGHEILIMDDPLSAVDAHVGAKIFDNCIKKALKNKTRILVTHQLQYLDKFDVIYVMEKGKIQQKGTYKELLNEGYDFAKLLQEIENNTKNPTSSNASSSNSLSISGSNPLNISLSPVSQDGLMKISTSLEDLEIPLEKTEKMLQEGVLIDEEESSTGSVKMDVYKQYFKATGSYFILVFLFVVSLINTASSNFLNIWLSIWSDDTNAKIKFYMTIYLSILFLLALTSFLRQFVWAKASLDASKNLHDNLLKAILKAPMSYFYKTPTGRIVNRFSKDLSDVDTWIPDLASDFFLCLFESASIFLMICYLQKWFIIAIVPISITYFFIMQYYRRSSRELARLLSISSSPIYSQYQETIQGLKIIRSFDKQEEFVEENVKIFTNFSETYFLQQSAHKWLGLRTNLIGVVVYGIVASTFILIRGNISAGLVGLTLMYSSSVTGSLNWFVRAGVQLESSMNKVERILEYTKTLPEVEIFKPLSSLEQNEKPPRMEDLNSISLFDDEDEDEEITKQYIPTVDHPNGKNWPSQGKITFQNVCMRYKEKGDNVLDNVNFTIYSGEKVGIVGRTGAGKSTLINSIFRLVEIHTGSIVIDDFDIQKVNLEKLRNSITIIPQDPVLFSGTVRTNLDPFSEYEDLAIWEALKRCHLNDFIESLPKKLESGVESNGSNFSVGQRQLLCMSRALLRKTKILVMDEATASVDNETDGIIQRTVRTEFKDRTILTIAHRLNTIMDYDRILVMNKGTAVEFDTPIKLLTEYTGGFFYNLVMDTGEQSSKYLTQLAKKEISII